MMFPCSLIRLPLSIIDVFDININNNNLCNKYEINDNNNNNKNNYNNKNDNNKVSKNNNVNESIKRSRYEY
jgi:hypothetical protein